MHAKRLSSRWLEMKKNFAVIAFTLFAFSLFAAAPSHSESAAINAGMLLPNEGEKVEAQADAELPSEEPAKPTLHTLFIASTQGVAVDQADSGNFVLAKIAVGKIVLTKRLSHETNAGDNPDDEARCNARGRCFTVRKTGVFTIASKEKVTRYHLKNIFVGEGSVSAEVFLEKESVGSISLTLVRMAGSHDAWTGTTAISGKNWNAYIPLKSHRKLVRPAIIHKAIEIGNKCGLTRPLALDASVIRECVQNGGKAAVNKVEGCPKVECVKPEKTVRELSANIKAKCEAKGGTLVRKQIMVNKKIGEDAGFKVVCVVEGKVVEESDGSTQQAGAAQTATATIKPTAATAVPTATPSPSATAQPSVSASTSVGIS